MSGLPHPATYGFATSGLVAFVVRGLNPCWALLEVIQVSLTVDELRNEALQLPIAERARLATDLISSLDDLGDVDQDAVDAAWAEEVRRRMQGLRNGTVKTVSAEEVLKEARRLLQK